MPRPFPGVLRARISAVIVLMLGVGLWIGPMDARGQVTASSQEPGFRTIATFPNGVEGLTGDEDGNLYVGGRGTDCPIWRVRVVDGTTTQIGIIPGMCSPLGMAFDGAGQLHVLSGDSVFRLPANASGSTPATQVASGMPGANGIAFDRDGAMVISDGVTSQGRVWRVSPSGEVREAFRVQALSNDVNVVDGVGGVGRDARSLPPGSVSVTPAGRSSANAEGAFAIVANGVAFGPQGTLFIADTARGAIWTAAFDASGNLLSPTGCDTTFSSNTLCMENLLVAHPLLEGADGIALDVAGNIWVAANERNAVVMVTPDGRVIEVFRNAPDPETRLRNAGPLEFPTSPFLMGTTLCVSQTDGSRRDNAPSTLGELAPNSPSQGKISCMNGQVPLPGLPLPVR